MTELCASAASRTLNQIKNSIRPTADDPGKTTGPQRPQRLESAARRAAQEFMHASLKYRYAYPDPDVDAPKAPELHPPLGGD